jgi:hypothetical protein
VDSGQILEAILANGNLQVEVRKLLK